MSFLASNKIKDLRSENEELKSQLRRHYEKEETVKRLEDVLQNMRSEILWVKKDKLKISSIVDDMKIEVAAHNKTKKEILNEIEKLKRNKIEGQNNLWRLKEQQNKFDNKIQEQNTISKLNSDKLSKDITTAEKIRKNLSAANSNLEERNSKLNNRLHLLTEQEKEITNKINLKQAELQQLNSFESTNLKGEFKILEEKIKTLRETELRLTSEMENGISDLKEEEASLQDAIDVKMRELKEADDKNVIKKSSELKSIEDKLLALIVEDQKISENVKQKKIDTNNLNDTISKLEEKTKTIKTNLEQLKSTEDLKTEWIVEINETLSEKEIKLTSLDEELDNKSKQLNDFTQKLNGLSEQFKTKENELQEREHNLELKTNLLNKISDDYSEIEDKATRLQAEAHNFEIRKDEAHKKLVKEIAEYNNLKEENKKLKEIIPLLEQRKIEIKQSNESLELRFSDMLQKLNKSMNEMNKKRSVLEQIILKKEKDLEEKDQLLIEKVTALEESERILNMRHEEIDSFEVLIKTINEQKELVKNDLLKLDDKTTDQRNLIGDLQLEIEMLQKKKLTIGNNLQDILYSMNNRLRKNSDNTVKLNSEIKEYENRLTELNKSIKESVSELVELQTSISNIKVEHEEHRGEIIKLVTMKKKIEHDISKHQSVLQKYQKISEKIKFERAMMQKMSSPESESNALFDDTKTNKALKPGDQFLKV